MTKKEPTFHERYQLECLRSGTAPLHAIEAKLKDRSLDFHFFRIPHSDWQPFQTSLAADNTLEKIHIKIDDKDTSLVHKPEHQTSLSSLTPCQKKKLKHIPYLIQALASNLSKSTVLTHISLQGLPLRPSDVEYFAQGLASNSSIQYVSLKCTRLSLENLRVITTVLKNKPNLVWLNLQNCQLNPECIKLIAEMIQHQSVCRQTAVWKETLRRGLPNLEAMAGLRRITLNQNQICDFGLKLLASALKDDLWVKVLDLQNCGITDEGGHVIIKLLTEHNANLSLIDVRENNEISWEVLDEIRDMLVTRNPSPVDVQYLPLPITKASTVSSKTTVRKVIKKIPLKPKPTPGTSSKSPWRFTARLNQSLSSKSVKTPAKLSKKTCKRDSESDLTSAKLVSELEEERRLRFEAEKRVLELAEQLESEAQRYISLKDKYQSLKKKKKTVSVSGNENKGIWVHQQTLEAIKCSLARTHTVLSSLKANGMYDLAARIENQPNSPRSQPSSAHTELKSNRDTVDHNSEPLASLKEDLQAVLATLMAEAPPEPSVLTSLNHSFLSEHVTSQNLYSQAISVSRSSKTLRSSQQKDQYEENYSISFEKPSASSKPKSRSILRSQAKSMSVSSNISSIMDFLGEITLNSDVSPP